jgi:predicted TIM-barrel fold metal-dependent hydrolase
MTERDLDAIPLLDHHCHAIRRLAGPLDLPGFLPFFTESRETGQIRDHVPHTLFFRWAVRELAAWLGTPPEAEAVLAARAACGADFARDILADARLEGLFLDTGFATTESLALAEMAELAPCPIRPILRLETLIESLLPGAPDLETLLGRFLDAVRRAPAEGAVALKSIAAYRTGLEIGDPARAEAERAFAVVRSGLDRTGRTRLAEPDLLHFCLRHAFAVAAEIGLPVQLHTGFGDADADLRTANPLQFRAILEDRRYTGTTFVLLHAGYPFVRETAHLAALYANVYLDTSLAIPLVGPFSPQIWRDALSLAPTSKIMAATDAFGLPEHFWLAARWSRRSLARVLIELIADGVLDDSGARAVAEAILYGNARRVYRFSP